MKKVLFVLCALLAFSSVSYAQTPINFLYLHGTDQGPAPEFQAWMDRMQPDMKKNLSDNDLFKEKVLKDAYIKDTPQMVFWADRTNSGRRTLANSLSISKAISACLPQGVRSFVAYMLHDVVWLDKYSNMKSINDDINKTVIQNWKNGEKTILVGYSAGTLITYQYLLDKSKYIHPLSFAKRYKKQLKLSDKYVNYISQYATKPTCVDAIVDSGIGFINGDGGLMFNPNEEERLNGIKILNTQSQLSCTPDNATIGVINFGSPLLVFHSDIADKDSQINFLTKALEQNMIQTGQFYLTVNYKKDPIAVPIPNIPFDDIQQYIPNTRNGGGFIYHTMVNGGTNFLISHLKYWDFTNSFTKKVAKSFEEGYKFFYGINNQQN